MENGLYTVVEAAEMIGKKPKNILNLLSYHKLPRVRGNGNKVYISEEVIRQLSEFTPENRNKKNSEEMKGKPGRNKFGRNGRQGMKWKGSRSIFKPSGYWKASVFDEKIGRFIVKKCCMSYAEALEYQNQIIHSDRICRITPH